MRESIRSACDYAQWNSLHCIGTAWPRWSHICPFLDFCPLAVAVCGYYCSFFPLRFSSCAFGSWTQSTEFLINLMKKYFRFPKTRPPLSVTPMLVWLPYAASWFISRATETRKGPSNLPILPSFPFRSSFLCTAWNYNAVNRGCLLTFFLLCKSLMLCNQASRWWISLYWLTYL